MKKVCVLICFGLLVFTLAASNAISEMRYFEAETFKGDTGVVKDDATASGGKAVFGESWYAFSQGVPIPEEKHFCFARIRSDVPANWFLAYDTSKPFGWFKTTGGDKWEWVRLGEFQKTEKNQGMMPRVFLQKAIGAPKVKGALDAMVFASSPAEAQKEFEQRNAVARQSAAAAPKSILLEAEDF